MSNEQTVSSTQTFAGASIASPVNVWVSVLFPDDCEKKVRRLCIAICVAAHELPISRLITWTASVHDADGDDDDGGVDGNNADDHGDNEAEPQRAILPTGN